MAELASLLATSDRPGDMVEYFLTAAVGLRYDAEIVGDVLHG